MRPVIAIVTDEVLFVKLIEPLLSRKIAEVDIVVCKSYQEINERFDNESCSLILLDGSMSSLSSIEILQYLRVKKQIICPVWFFPEILTEAYIYKSCEMGATRIIKKPFDPHKVTDEIALSLMKITLI